MLFIILLLVLPSILALANMSIRGAAALSIALYVLAQSGQTESGTTGWSAITPFDPFAWQVLYFLGCVAGSPGFAPYLKCVSSRLFLFAAVMVLDLSCYCKLSDLVDFGFFASKRNLGLVRIVHFLSMAVVVYKGAGQCVACKSRVMIVLVMCGRNSLVVFSTAAVAGAIASAFLANYRDDQLFQAIVTSSAWLLCLFASSVAEEIKRARSRLRIAIALVWKVTRRKV
jgi:hypothetical protein